MRRRQSEINDIGLPQSKPIFLIHCLPPTTKRIFPGSFVSPRTAAAYTAVMLPADWTILIDRQTTQTAISTRPG